MAKITLKNDSVIFTLPSIKLSLNYENMSADIILGQLSQQDRASLSVAAGRGLIDCDEPVAVNVPVVQPNIPAPPITKDTLKQRYQQQEKEERKQLVAILNQNAAVIKKQLAKTNNIRLVRKMLELEKIGKKRKGVLSFLKDMVEKFEVKAVSSADADTNIILSDKAKEQLSIGLDYPIEQSEIVEVPVVFSEV